MPNSRESMEKLVVWRQKRCLLLKNVCFGSDMLCVCVVDVLVSGCWWHVFSVGVFGAMCPFLISIVLLGSKRVRSIAFLHYQSVSACSFWEDGTGLGALPTPVNSDPQGLQLGDPYFYKPSISSVAGTVSRRHGCFSYISIPYWTCWLSGWFGKNRLLTLGEKRSSDTNRNSRKPRGWQLEVGSVRMVDDIESNINIAKNNASEEVSPNYTPSSWQEKWFTTDSRQWTFFTLPDV